MIRIVFGIIASLGILMALGTVLARNLVHAALFLMAFFFLIACQFVLLEAEFMAAMQVLVYIGAVAIILMFGIMLTRNIQGDETTSGRWTSKIPAALIAGGMLALLIAGIVEEKGSQTRLAWTEIKVRPKFYEPTVKGLSEEPRSAAIADMGRAVGNEMLQRYLISFEVAGLLLTAALVGAVVLAQAEESEIVKRFGSTLDARGSTTQEPQVSLDNKPAAAAPASLAGAKLSPFGEANQSWS